jgi:hypothetical protein
MVRSVRFVVALLIVGLGTGTAFAEDETVVRRLTKHGALGRNQAQSLARDVSKRMKQAADMTAADDPLRMAMSRAIGIAPGKQDAMAAAKIRLRLYAGLNEWALDNLFAPKPGALARCQQELKLTSRQCDALVAASGRISVEEASNLGGGAAQAGASMVAAASRAAPQQAANGRFQRYDSGYRGAQPAARPTPQPMAARPVQPVAAARPMPQPVVATNTKNDYQARRAAYLERQRLQMEARKAKLTANVAGAPVQRGPGSAEEAAVAGLPAESVAAAPAPAATQAKAPAAEPTEAAAAEPAAEPAKAALDDGFLDSLLADPLGK